MREKLALHRQNRIEEHHYRGTSRNGEAVKSLRKEKTLRHRRHRRDCARLLAVVAILPDTWDGLALPTGQDSGWLW